MGVDAVKAAIRRKAAKIAALVTKTRRAAYNLRQQPGGPGWLKAEIAETVYRTGDPNPNSTDRRPFMWSRLTGFCACCQGVTLHSVSTADLRDNADEIRCLCASCWVLVCQHDRRT